MLKQNPSIRSALTVMNNGYLAGTVLRRGSSAIRNTFNDYLLDGE